MSSPVCSASSQRPSKPPWTPTISMIFGLRSWPIPNSRTAWPLWSRCLIVGMWVSRGEPSGGTFRVDRRSPIIPGEDRLPMVMAEVARVERTSRGPRLRLAFGRLLWSVTGVLIVIREAGLWWFLHRMRVGPGPSRLLALIYYSPGLMFQCLLVGAIIAVAADLIVRLVVRPLAARWYSPREDASSSHPAPFRLGPDEAIELEMPARRRVGRRWLPGTLLGTNRRAWFFPFAWDAEPWSCPWE